MRGIATCLLTTMLAAGAGFAQTTPSDQKPILGDWGIETQFISKDIKPGDDFYRYVNEGWLQTDGCVSRVVEILLSRPPSGLICA